ncbi:NAD(P)-dependent oxidoreductase [Terracoccus sp. 273MFTsu3.1]|uniref:NAD(P)-dependent oxidoreductase n=1 Tax=Terracoccus sp. 273MFTsu3.1 TaxID=1172188 RepID=UPI000377D4A4|nr:NAD(P)-binding oxidoreductase [Terracoccus sp. 273MFTsu3.1]
MSRVILIGGHGKVALLAAPLLVSDGHDVTSVVRNPDHVADVEATGATAAVLDVEHATTEQIGDLVRGSDVVVWSAGAGGGSPERTYAVDRDAAIRSMDAAEQAGVGRYVMVSYFGAGPDHGVPEDDGFYAYAEAKAAADEHLQGTDLAWTILRPSGLTTDAATGHIETGAGVQAGKVSRDNVAHVIRAVVEHPDTTARRILPFNDGYRPIDEVIGTTPTATA